MKTSRAAKLLNVRPQTILEYIKKGRLKASQLETGIYVVDDESVYRMLNPERMNIVYARVSTRKQKSHLDKQINDCKQFMLASGLTVDKVYSEIASGLTLDRKELQKLIDDVTSYRVKNIVITFKDRLTRIGFSMLEQLFAKYGCKIVTVDSTKKTSEQELLDEVVSILHVYATKLYGTRRKHLQNAAEHVNIVREELENGNSNNS